MPIITGDNLKNHLAGTTGADVIFGYGEDDTIAGDIGTDTIWGGDGNDWADGGTWDDRMYGEAGNDTLLGGTGNDDLNGGGDNDSLTGGEGNDTLDGGLGIDTMTGGLGNDVYVKTEWNDVVIEAADAGIDEIRLDDFFVHYPAIWSVGQNKYVDDTRFPTYYTTFDLEGTNIENMTYFDSHVFFGSGTEGANVIKASGLVVGIQARGGNDRIETTAAHAAIDAGTGHDTVIGGNGAEQAYGNVGNDLLSLGGGDDFGAGGNGSDTVLGGAGNDTLDGGAANDVVDGGDGDDFLTTRGDVTVAWSTTDGPHVASGAHFDATVTGAANDGAGDLLIGGAGNDTIIGFGGDTVQGGSGDDLYHVLGGSQPTIIEDRGGGVDKVFLVGAGSYSLGATLEDLQIARKGAIEGGTFAGNAGDNRITGSDAGEAISGLGGNDEISGNGGRDSIYGGEGDDFVNGGFHMRITDLATGQSWFLGSDGDGDDLVDGGLGNDTVFGSGGNDTLKGGEGDDEIVGGLGTDELWGGAGADTFRFSHGDSGTGGLKRDVIKDFVRGEDVVDFSSFGLDMSWGLGGEGEAPQPLHLATGAEAYGVWQGVDKPKSPGGIIAQAPGTRLMIDTDGDALADMVVTVQFGDGLAAGPLASTDFIF